MFESEVKACSDMGQTMPVDKRPLQFTVGQNIEQQIAELRGEITRLEKLKKTLSEGSILNVAVHDLRRVLQY